MSLLTSVFACPLGDDVPYDDSVRIRLENQALLRSGWRSPSNSTTSCYIASTMIIDRQIGKD